MSQKAPGKSHREGISLVELFELFPDEATATAWFEASVWPTGRCCSHCGSLRTYPVPNANPMPYHCRDCRSYFSVRTKTALERSKIPLQKWAIAIYLEMTSLRIPVETDHPFQSKPITDSIPSRSPIPVDADH